MAQLSQPVEPFGEVNVYPQPDGSVDIVATVLMVPDIEGARTGLALDASASMKSMYGVSSVLGGAFAKAAATPNVVEPVARMMAAYLSQFSSTGTCDIIYWAVSPAGNDIDLWDHKLAAEMRKIEEIFAEVVSEDATVAASGRVTNQAGVLCKNYPDGLPALLRFKMPPGSTGFTIDFPGGSITQDLTAPLTP